MLRLPVICCSLSTQKPRSARHSAAPSSALFASRLFGRFFLLLKLACIQLDRDAPVAQQLEQHAYAFHPVQLRTPTGAIGKLTYLHQAFHTTSEPGTVDQDREEHGDVQGKDPSHHG